MQGQMEVEEILEQRLWADRNGVELGSAYVPAQALRRHELKTYRDCPAPDAYDDMRTVPIGWTVLGMLIFGALAAAVVWNWPHA